MINYHFVLICGDRNYTEAYARCVKKTIRKLVQKHGATKLVLIEGGAPGVDTLVRICGEKMNVHVCEVKALWETRKKSAGPQRNKVMAALKPNEVIGIHEDFSKSVGTAHMCKLAEELEIPLTRISP